MTKIETPDDYVRLALRTESAKMPLIPARALDHPNNHYDEQETDSRLLHAGMGLCTETGEFQDAQKRKLFYGKPWDRNNLIEELGDTLWYIAIACDALQISMIDVMIRNINKLRARYPEKFDEEKAVNRNLDAERKALEG